MISSSPSKAIQSNLELLVLDNTVGENIISNTKIRNNYCVIKTLKFLYCFPYSFCSSNYCDSNSFRSFTLLKALAKSNGNLFAIAFKSDSNIGFLYCILFVSFLWFFFDGSLSKVIALLTIAIAIVVALKGDSEKITVTFR